MRNGRKTDIFVDVCTQQDYLAPDGARPALNAARVVPNLKHLVALARWGHVPMLSCVEARRADDVRGLANADCVVGTVGQRKLPFTLLPDRVLMDSDNCLCVALDVLQQHPQVILTKEHRDPFTNPKLDRLLTETPARRLILFGVSLETSIRLLALGLMLRHRCVAVVHDACAWWDRDQGEMALRQLAAKSCDLVSTHELIRSALAQFASGGRRVTYRRRSVA